MQVGGWAEIPDDDKEDLFRKLKNKVELEMDQPHVRKSVEKAFAKQYSTFRSKAHEYYKRMKAKSGIDAAKEKFIPNLRIVNMIGFGYVTFLRLRTSRYYLPSNREIDQN